MNKIDRRKFLKNSASATGMLFLTPYLGGSMLSSSKSIQTGYFESEFGIDDMMCQMLLEKALSRGGDFADIYFEHSLENWLVLEDGKVDRSYGNVLLGVGIRTVKGDQTGYGFTQELTKESMLSAAATAASLVNESAKPVAKNNYSQPYVPIVEPEVSIKGLFFGGLFSGCGIIAEEALDKPRKEDAGIPDADADDGDFADGDEIQVSFQVFLCFPHGNQVSAFLLFQKGQCFIGRNPVEPGVQ